MDQLKMDQLSLQSDRSDLIKNYRFSIAESIARIRSNIENWTQAYTVETPIEGIVTFNNTIQENKTIRTGQIIGYVLPENSNKKFLSCALPTTNIGKVEEGQRVIVKFDAFPYKEFGLLESTVASLGKVPELSPDNMPFYEVLVPLPDPIISDFGETIPYQPNMTAMVEIITEDKSILERIFDQFISLVKSNS